MSIKTYGDALAFVHQLDGRMDTSSGEDLLDLLIKLGVWSPADNCERDMENAANAMVAVGYDQQFIVKIINDLKKVGFRLVKDN